MNRRMVSTFHEHELSVRDGPIRVSDHPRALANDLRTKLDAVAEPRPWLRQRPLVREGRDKGIKALVDRFGGVDCTLDITGNDEPERIAKRVALGVHLRLQVTEVCAGRRAGG